MMRSTVPVGGEFFVALAVLLSMLLVLEWTWSPPQRPGLLPPPAEGPVEFFLSQTELLCVVEDSAGRRRVLAYDSVLVLSYSRRLEQLVLSAALDSAGQLLWHSSQHKDATPIWLDIQPELRRVRVVWRFPWKTAPLLPGQHLYRLRLQASYTIGQTHHTEQLTALLRISFITAAPPPAPSPLSAERIPPPPLRLVPIESVLEAPPHGQWETEIVVFGMNVLTDMASPPQVSLIGDGKATVTPRTATSLLLRGTAPAIGQMQIAVTLTRRLDGEQATARIAVNARPLPRPEVPAEMYPERTYLLDPRLQLRGQAVRVELYGGQRLWTSSTAGTPLSVTPQLADTGTTLILRRFVNSQLLDETPIPIRDFPPPELLEVRSLERGLLQLRIRCFGTVRGEPNLCSASLDGTGTIRELYGNRRRHTAEPYGLITEQTFLLEGADPARPLEILFTDRAGRPLRWRR